jgi:hypothetical protein
MQQPRRSIAYSFAKAVVEQSQIVTDFDKSTLDHCILVNPDIVVSGISNPLIRKIDQEC